MLRKLVRPLCIGFLITAGNMVLAQQPVRFNYQAKLTEQGGAPLTGAHTITFSLYQGGSAVTTNSGTLVFSENLFAAFSVASGGQLTHAVGTGANTFGGSLTADMLHTSQDVFLQVAIDSPGNVLMPRTRINSVPFAVHALHSEDGVPSGAGIFTTSSVALAGYTVIRTLYPDWLLGTPLDLARQQLGAAVVGQYIYILGGAGGQPNESAVVYRYNPATHVVDTMAPMNQRFDFGCAAVNGKIYAISGFNPMSGFTGTVDMYDPDTNTWSPRTNIPQPRGAFAAAAVGNKIYCIGGASSGPVVETNRVYDTALDSWSTSTRLAANRTNHAAAALGGKVYIAGGNDYASGDLLSSMEMFDPVANTWTSKAPMLIARKRFCLIASGNTLHAIGGETTGSVLASDEEYDPNADTWKPVGHLQIGRTGHAGVDVNGQRFVFCGAVDSGASTRTPTTEYTEGDTVYLQAKN